MRNAEELKRTLARIDRRGYGAYREIEGCFDLGALELAIDRVQSDPFAAPSRVRLRVAAARAALPADLTGSPVRRLALADYLARRARAAVRELTASRARRGSGKSGAVNVDAGGQEVLARTAVAIREAWAELRLEAGLPAAGRTVLGREAAHLLLELLPAVAERSLVATRLPLDQARAFVACVEAQEHVRARLAERGLVAFVANGSILPRESGASDRPMRREEAVPFVSPPSLEVSFELPDGRRWTGMGIPRGVTVIVGGGYHGKSTLLRALERGVYPHVPGDGREGVVADRGLVKIRAEDGRRVECVDIRPFISDLPGGRRTDAFRSDDASGSTSQAANIVEAIEAGASGLLLDEDTSATNFMIRDARMQALVAKEHEPITPFLDRVRELYENLGVSTVLVMGGSGDYLDVADRVILMREFRAEDATERAREVCTELGAGGRKREAPAPLRAVTPRIPLAESFDASRGRREVKIDAKGIDSLLYGTTPIELRGVEQIVDRSQTRAIGLAIHLATRRFMDGRATLAEVLGRIEEVLDGDGLEALDPWRTGRRAEGHPGNLARPRRFEIAAAINRLRTVRMRLARGSRSDEEGGRRRRS